MDILELKNTITEIKNFRGWAQQQNRIHSSKGKKSVNLNIEQKLPNLNNREKIDEQKRTKKEMLDFNK